MKLVWTSVLALGLAGCGGGGGGGGQQQPPASTYTVGGAVMGANDIVVLRLNGGGDLSAVPGPFTFSTGLATGASYTVTIARQPATQDCVIAGGTGTIASTNVVSVNITCAMKTYTVGGALSGLAGTLVLRNNGASNLTLTADGTFTFGGSVDHGVAYNVSVLTQPANQTCAVTNGIGTATANVTNVAVACASNPPNPNNPTPTRQIGGTVGGLAGTVVLRNGANDLPLSTNGSFVFGTIVANGASYNVTVLTQPAGQTCIVTNGAGTATANVTNVAVTCTNNPVVTHAIGGTVSGLAGTVVLRNNGGTGLALSSNGAFEFSTAIPNGTTYSVTVQTQPASQTCTVANGSGTATARVTSIAVTCSTHTYTIGGTVSGLTGTVVLRYGANDRSLSSNGAFELGSAILHGTNYNVTVQAQPAGQTCSVANGAGTATANVTNIAVTCSSQSHTIGGTLSGLAGTVVLRNNGDDLTLSTNGPFVFGAAVANGAAYDVTVSTQPAGQTCTVTNGGGTATANVTNVTVACVQGVNRFIGGTVSGLNPLLAGTVVLRNNGGNDLSLSINGAFSFSTPIPHGTTYDVTVQTQPVGQTCTVTNGSGTATAGVTNIAVACSTHTYTIGGTVSGLTGTIVLRYNGAADLSLSANGAFTLTHAVDHGTNYVVGVFTHPDGQNCTVTNGVSTLRANVTNVAVVCTSFNRFIGGTVSGLNPLLAGTVVLRNNNGNDLSLSINGAFSFSTPIPHGTTYDVTVQTQPVGQTCTVTNGSGTATAGVTNIAVACSTHTYTIGGTVSGLTGTVVLRHNGANDLSLSANGAFTFTNAVNHGTNYNVGVFTQPNGQNCTVTNGSGPLTANVTNVAVVCTSFNRFIGGTVSGLNPLLAGTVVLRNNGGNDLSLSSNGAFEFSAPIPHGTTYDVTVQTQPVGQACTVTNGSGTATARVTNIAVACSTHTYTIGGAVSGLNGTVVLRNNGGNDLSLSANGNLAFTTALNHGAAYNVTVLTQPVGQTCSVTNGAGTATANVTNVAVACVTMTYTIGGTLTGLAGPIVLRNNAGDDLPLSANGAFVFGTPVAHGGAYGVTVATQPAGQSCTVTTGSGTATANVSNVAVHCVYPQLAATGKSLVVTTANFVATFAGADLVGLQNRLTGETYLKNPSTGDLAAFALKGQGTGQVLQASSWKVAVENGQLVASIALTDSARTMTMRVNIDAASQEVVVKTQAALAAPMQGIYDASWSMAGLDLSGGRLIVPTATGEVFDAAHPPTSAYMQYPNTWHAQMFVYETPFGSFVAYSTDSQYRFKLLRAGSRGQGTFDVAIATEAPAPFNTATSVPEVEWRLRAVDGDWKAAAQVYKTWLAVNRPPAARSPALAWVDDIRSVVIMHPNDVSHIDQLAALPLDPAKTLIYLVDWRIDGYDVDYPDYTPRTTPASAASATIVQRAHTLGFKVMLHTDLIGVSTGNADYAAVSAFQVRNADNPSLLTGWLWDCPACTNRFAFINPASSQFRSLLIQRIAVAVNALQPDALHLDISGPMYSDGNGPIEGMTYPQGSVRLHEDLIAAFPNLALGGESENDVIYGYHQFAQAFFYGEDAAHGHPIANFLFNPQVQYYGHLGQPVATDSTFRANLSDLERRAVTPGLAVYQASDLDFNVPDNARLINLLDSWNDNAFQPDWSTDWNGSLARYTGNLGRTAELTDSGNVETLTAAGVTLYELAHGVNELASSSYIRDWPAFDNSALYGLDPAKKYWLDFLPRPSTTHITSLPSGTRLGPDTFVTPTAALFDLAGPASSPAFDFEKLSSATLGVRYQGSDWPLGYGAVVIAQNMTVGGQTRRALYLQTPWQGQNGGETFAEYSVPVAANATLRFSVGINDGLPCNDDGVRFRVAVNDVELYSQDYLTGAWHDGSVDLSAYANQNVRLRLTSHPGPQGSSACDSSAWSQLAIVYPLPLTIPTISVPLALDSGGVFSGFAGDGSSSFAAGTVANLPVPGRFVVFSQPGVAIANGTNLLSLLPAVEPWQGSRGEMLAKGGVFGAGTIGPATIATVTRNPAINAHPPNDGRVVFSWTLQVPGTPMSLGWAAALVSNASNDGVDFSVLINGVPYWQVTRTFGAWITSSVELTPWAGQSILVQLVADSRANNGSDASYWGDVITSTSAVTCSYTLAATQATPGAPGGAFTLNVLPPLAASCPWQATSGVPWVTITSARGRTGTGAVNYTVAQNSGAPRTGTLTIAGQIFTIRQADANGVLPP